MTKIALRFAARARRAPTLAAVAAISALAMLAGCISPRVEVEASDPAPIARARTIHVSLASAEASASESAGTSTTPPAPAIAEALRADAERQLALRGYAMGSAEASELVLEIAAQSERSARRTWTSDPDANGATTVRKSEAVVALRARERESGQEIWACDARARLPESAPVLGTSAEEVWLRVLTAALEDVPRRE
ncbi:MAG: hypothetical protein R3F21_08885 [Myxococcota bacterium]